MGGQFVLGCVIVGVIDVVGRCLLVVFRLGGLESSSAGGGVRFWGGLARDEA